MTYQSQTIRLLIATAVIALCTSELQARSPFGRGRFRRGVQQNVHRATQPNAINRRTQSTQSNAKFFLDDPVEMTKRFGPSILIREETEGTDASKFVTQPK